MTTTDLAPKGEMVLRTLAMPADTNANGDIFGGWLMSQMDIGGAIMAKEIAQWSRGDRAGGWDDLFTSGRRWRRGVLLRPLREARQHLGDNQYRSVGEKVSSEPIGQRYKATEALFIYVAVDNQGKPRPLPAE